MNDSMVTIMGFTFNIYGALILGFLLFLAGAFWRAQKRGHLNWTDMITRDGEKVSATKVLQLVGGAVGTWIVIQMTLKSQLTWDMFAIYLGYVASIDGFSKLVLAKYGSMGGGNYQQYPPQYQQPQYQSDDDNEPLLARRTPNQQVNGAAKTPDID